MILEERKEFVLGSLSVYLDLSKFTFYENLGFLENWCRRMAEDTLYSECVSTANMSESPKYASFELLFESKRKAVGTKVRKRVPTTSNCGDRSLPTLESLQQKQYMAQERREVRILTHMTCRWLFRTRRRRVTEILMLSRSSRRKELHLFQLSKSIKRWKMFHMKSSCLNEYNVISKMLLNFIVEI